MGYNGKAAAWGVAMASVIVAASRYYVTKKHVPGLMIDEQHLKKNCITTAPVIYSKMI